MSESFAELFENSVKLELDNSGLITGLVVNIDDDWVTIDAGLKSEGVIPREEFLDDSRQLEVALGDEVEVTIESLDDGFGSTRLSREKAKRAATWKRLEKAQEDQEIVIGIINGKVKGGFTVEVQGIRAFLPGSLVDVRPIRDTTHLEGQPLEFKVLKLDEKRNNVVVSRRAVMEAENSADRDELLANLAEGQEIKGIIKNLTDYGAFVDLGGVDGLLHITDMSWKRIKHPSEIVEVGQEMLVKVLKFDKEASRVSLGLKQMGEDPWESLKNRFPVGSKVSAKVTNLTDYGCFAELEEGLEGLVHVSEMDWTNKNIHPSKIVNVGDEVEVMILDINEERRRISLGIKQCKVNPWDDFGQRNEKGTKIKGSIKSITDFGIFLGLEGGIDGLVHLSDISWDEPGEIAVRNFKKGDEIETVILSVDADRERISLGIKQLIDDPYGNYLAANEKGSIIKGVISEVDAKGAVIDLAEEVQGYLKASDIAQERVEDASQHLKVGDEVEAKIVGFDKKNRSVNLSIKAKDFADEKEALQEHNSQASDASPTTIGDLIKAKLDDQ
jgi:small subunit ribosomal protein S1